VLLVCKGVRSCFEEKPMILTEGQCTSFLSPRQVLFGLMFLLTSLATVGTNDGVKRSLRCWSLRSAGQPQPHGDTVCTKFSFWQVGELTEVMISKGYENGQDVVRSKLNSFGDGSYDEFGRSCEILTVGSKGSPSTDLIHLAEGVKQRHDC
jgi:hypothetical protein